MAYQVLARKYRPLRFSDVVGQDHVTRTLLNALSQQRIAHGYIFSGHRGIGKTTIARILASALNCRTEIGTELRPTPEPCNVCESCLEIRQGSAVDVIEIDAATNRGIDEIRELRDAARYRPARDKFKIYILDEAHQITDAAFNALLKTLEEPPEHIVFMMATTEPENIPQTIRSRCQHFSFHAVKLEDIVGQLRKISDDESILVDDTTLALLAEAGDGSMRDALSIMDQAIASAPMADGKPHLEINQIRELMGSVSNVIYEQVLEAVHANNSADVLNIIARLLDAGNGATQIARQFVRYLRNCVVAKITGLSPEPETVATGIAADLLQISPEERSRVARSASLFTEEELSRFLAIMLRTFDELGYRQEQRFHLELGLLKLVHLQRLLPIEELLSQLGTPGEATPKPVATPTTGRPATPPPAPRAATSAPAAATSSPFAAPTSSPFGGAPRPNTPAAPSPFEADRSRKAPQGSTATSAPTPSPQPTAGALAIAPEPVLPPKPNPVVTPTAPQTTAQPGTLHPIENPGAPLPALSLSKGLDSETWAVQPPKPAPTADRPHLVSTPAPTPVISAFGTPNPSTPAPQPQPEPTAATPASAPTGDHDLNALQTALVEALTNAKGQETASHQIEDATFALNGTVLEIQTSVSKAMLPALFNAEANKLLAAALRQHAPGLTFTLVPGTPASAAAKKTSNRAPRAGSAAELAEKHPMVQEAKRLFSAEISNIIDLRDK